MGWKAETPLAKTLQSLGVTQKRLAAWLDVDQAQVCGLCRRVATPKMAARVLEAIDPGRVVLTELHLLFPERYPEFTPSVPAGFVPGRPAQAPGAVQGVQEPVPPSDS